jgi:hypothetical protein
MVLGEELKAAMCQHSLWSSVLTPPRLRLCRYRPLDDMAWVPELVLIQNAGAQGTSSRSSNHAIGDVPGVSAHPMPGDGG